MATFEKSGIFHKAGSGGGGGGGSDPHNLGWYADLSALQTAHPTGVDGDFAILGSTDTVWVWDSGTSAWKDTDQKGQVESVNGQTGAVVLDAEDVGALPVGTTAHQIGAVPQYVTLPAVDESNLGEVVQYVGVNIPDVESDATITQTVGSSLSDLEVDVVYFEAAEKPAADETVDFTYVVSESVSPTEGSVSNITVTIDNQATFIAAVKQAILSQTGSDTFDIVEIIVEKQSSESAEEFAININQNNTWYLINAINPADYGITYTGTLDDVGVPYTAIMTYHSESKKWFLRGNEVTISNYGITYSGTPVDGDTLRVSYTAFVEGVINSYFYKVEQVYSPKRATITQTVGSGLTSLAVDVDTFVEEEQPTQSGNTSFVASAQTTVTPLTVGEYVNGEYIEATINPQVFFAKAREVFGDSVVDNGSTVTLGIIDAAWNMAVCIDGDEHRVNGQIAEDWGIVYNQVPTTGGGATAWLNYTIEREVTWSKNGTTIDLTDYGISYSGVPVSGDTLTVAYVAPSVIGYDWNKVDYGTTIIITTEV